MTRNELIQYATKLYYRTSLMKNDASYVTVNSLVFHYSELDCDVLVSHSIIAGIYNRTSRTLYAFGTYHNTVVKPIYKASKMLNATSITWLCVRSDKRVEQYIGHYVDESRIFYADKEELDNLIRCDWSSEIETKWKEF